MLDDFPAALVYPKMSTATILVVDDDSEILSLVARFLHSNAFDVQTARSGTEMLACLANVTVDLIVLDLMLPGVSGLDLCRELRRTSSVPVIMLTAKGDDIDRIVGLEVGADDYLAKPFNPRELLARISAVLRRTQARPSVHVAAPQRIARFAGWRLDTMKRELADPRGVIVDLSTGEYELLVAFLDAPQRVLSRDFLLDATRIRASESFDRSIDVQISRLRRKIEAEHEMIKTVRGAGYMFTPDVIRGGA
ncbi:MAG: two-component system OmpR family response [Beijerinckiaceae bacterium]|nr:MAG: two-component system OmpR family response [Beijerinckiaceae bacterium]